MTEKELKRLSRADLLEMLIEQSKEVQMLRKRLETAESALARREIIIGSAGSIAEASLKLNGVFEAAQAACEQYIENVRMLSERQEAYYKRFGETKSSIQPETQKKAAEPEKPEELLGPRRTRRRASRI